MAQKQITKALLIMDRQTKGTVLYINEKRGQAINNMYIRKDKLPEPYPSTIEVTVTTDSPDGE